MKITQGWVYRDYVLFGLRDDRRDPLVDPMWLWGETNQWVRFAKPPENIVYESVD